MQGVGPGEERGREKGHERSNGLTLSQSFCSSVIAVGDSISGRMLNA